MAEYRQVLQDYVCNSLARLCIPPYKIERFFTLLMTIHRCRIYELLLQKKPPERPPDLAGLL